MMIGKGINDIDVYIPSDAYDTGKDIPTFNAYIIAIVRDSTGKIIKVHRQRSRSPTANFIGLLLPLSWYNEVKSSFTITNVTGGTCSYQPGLGNGVSGITYPCSGCSTIGPTYLAMIWVGSGSQSNPYSTYKLAAPIANGTGAGQLVYGAVSPPAGISVSGSSAYLYLSQTFTNQSGNTITVTEVGIVLNLSIQANNSTTYTNCGQVLVWYDTLSSSISVPSGGTLEIYYTFTANP